MKQAKENFTDIYLVVCINNIVLYFMWLGWILNKFDISVVEKMFNTMTLAQPETFYTDVSLFYLKAIILMDYK